MNIQLFFLLSDNKERGKRKMKSQHIKTTQFERKKKNKMCVTKQKKQ